MLGVVRLPSQRASAVLAAAMLAIGVAVGAAIGPAPGTSFAGGRLPLLLASLAAKGQSAQTPQAGAAPVQPPPVQAQPTPAAAASSKPASSASSTAGASSGAATPATPSTPSTPAPTNTQKATLPPVTSVWLIELSGVSFAAALEQPAAAPYIDGQLIPQGTLMSGWSAIAGSAFASDAALAEHRSAAGAPPPILHSIVQPPCPEGAAGAGCAPETAGQLTAADEFLKATLASITGTAAYHEHGLVVVTFATIATASATGLPVGASTATLTSQPPSGVALLSPFVGAGARSSAPFNPTAPKQSLEKLLH
jgi:hypothetical protein